MDYSNASRAICHRNGTLIEMGRIKTTKKYWLTDRPKDCKYCGKPLPLPRHTSATTCETCRIENRKQWRRENDRTKKPTNPYEPDGSLKKNYIKKPGNCVHCKEPLPVPRHKTKKFCGDCRYEKDNERKRLVYEQARRMPDGTLLPWGQTLKPRKCDTCSNQLAIPRWWSKRYCDDCIAEKKEKTRLKHAKRQAALQHAVLGRVCVACGRDDDGVFWSGNKKYCGACARQRQRQESCPRCDGPMHYYARAYEGGKLNEYGILACRKCDGKGFDPYCVDCGIIMPEGDERLRYCLHCRKKRQANGKA